VTIALAGGQSLVITADGDGPYVQFLQVSGQHDERALAGLLGGVLGVLAPRRVEDDLDPRAAAPRPRRGL
jgi:hypothetical protein